MMLLTWMPVSGTTMPEPSPFVHVTEQARPSPSITEMCVVEPIREPSRRARERRVAEAVDELRRARRLRLLHRAHDERERRRRRRLVEQPQREREQDPAGRRRRVRQHVAAAVATASGSRAIAS